ncbi:hypothetical protein D7V68_04310 [Acinetobacter cumulans]|uniref:hypothetical protein n=1 Tax=Acinetobacter cumulans TaxID=2136182 RepID=UPI000EA1BA6F|nr:hypothetical protein [Acinetobacter cumulans]RKG49887.1 hypothetical protein D7V68_04310 [Acinetobacter cumulans]
MNESNFQFFRELPEIGQLEKLTDKEIFGFLKRYYTDSYRHSITQNRKIHKGIFRETIETLERLYERLELVEKFIGYEKVDWKDACLSKNEVRKKQIVDFYNGLVVDVALMKLATPYYKLPEKIHAFINFLDKQGSCIFRSEIQSDKWKVEDFPHEDAFETIDQYKQYLKEQKNYKFNFDQDKGDEIAREILDVLHGAKKIRQALVLVKFQVQDFSDKEIKNLTQTSQVDHRLATTSVERKTHLLVDELNDLELGTHLPWLSILKKGEIELNGEVRLMFGFILDSSTHQIDTNQIKESLHRELDKFFYGSKIAAFVRSEIIAIDQILDHLGVKEIKEFKLPNRKKLALMLKWFVGLFYGMGKIISPDNHTAESQLVDTPIHLITRKADGRLKDRDDKRKSKRQEKHDLAKKTYDFNSIWDDASLVKRAPEYAKSIHKFYEMLKYFDELDAQQIKLLQRVNLFLAYLEHTYIDSLSTSLLLNQDPSKWPCAARMYLALLDNGIDINFSVWASNWTLYKTFSLPVSLNNSSLTYDLHDINLAEVTNLIAPELKLIKQHNISIPRSRLAYMEMLVQKNTRSAQCYLETSFKENTILLRFKIDNSQSRLDISTLKTIVTQFFKKAKRAPKSIGAYLDAYIGYFVFKDGCYSIDCTAICYLRSDVVADEVNLKFKDYWGKFTKRYTAKQKDTPELPDLRVIPSLWFKEGGSQYFVVNKRDKLIPQLINDLVYFYTAYEYFNKYKSTSHRNQKRPELFLRGRIKEAIPKKTDEKNTPQDEVSAPENEKSVNAINENSSQEGANKQADFYERRAERLARLILPL